MQMQLLPFVMSEYEFDDLNVMNLISHKNHYDKVLFLIFI